MEIENSRFEKDGTPIPLSTTNADSFTESVHTASNKKVTGRKRALLEAAMLERAKAACVIAEEQATAKDWISTQHEDFDLRFMYPELKDLGLLFNTFTVAQSRWNFPRKML